MIKDVLAQFRRDSLAAYRGLSQKPAAPQHRPAVPIPNVAEEFRPVSAAAAAADLLPADLRAALRTLLTHLQNDAILQPESKLLHPEVHEAFLLVQSWLEKE